MSDRPDHDPELGEERQVAEWLKSTTPLPAAGFRGALGRYLSKRDPRHGPRPPELRLISAGYVGAGAVLLLVGALQATGAL
jgi:hypothetical protein